MFELGLDRFSTKSPDPVHKVKRFPDVVFQSSMSSVDTPKISLAPDPSVPSAIPHTSTHSTPSVHRNIHAEVIELSEANAQLPSREHERSISQTRKSLRFRESIQFFSLCWTIFLAGWNDSSTGPLLPRIQSVYHVPSPSLLPARCTYNELTSGWLYYRFHGFYSKLHCEPTRAY